MTTYVSTPAGTGLWEIACDGKHVGSVAEKASHYTAYAPDGQLVGQYGAFQDAAVEAVGFSKTLATS